MIDNCQMHRSMYPSIFNVQPFPSNSTRKFKSSPFSTFLHILEARLQVHVHWMRNFRVDRMDNFTS